MARLHRRLHRQLRRRKAAAAAAPSGEAVTLEYWLWDASQLPPYQKCADDFMAKNPNIKINITQSGWDDYWNNIQTGMVAGTAPDVFTDHLAKYPEFAAKEQLVDIQPYVDSDKVDLSVYLGQLADLWARDGKRFGLPKDWDTIGIFYNKDMLKAAGVTEEELNNMTWNPDDGGTFAEIVAKLTIDENGNNGLSPDFDKTKVKQYGFVTDGAGGAYGQTRVELVDQHHRLELQRRSLCHVLQLRRPALHQDASSGTPT